MSPLEFLGNVLIGCAAIVIVTITVGIVFALVRAIMAKPAKK